MIRWLLLAATTLMISGCGRQVELVDPNASDVSVQETPAPGPAIEPGPAPAPAPAPDPNLDPGSVTNPGSDNSVISVRLSEPEVLLSTPAEIVPVLQAEDGTIIAMACCDNRNGWTADIELQQQSEWIGIVQWIVRQGERNITVLEADVRAANINTVQDITPDGYQRSLDDDGDGVDNLTEVVVGTNPLDANDFDANFSAVTAHIPRISSTGFPTVDGNAGDYIPGSIRFSGEWGSATATDINGEILSISNVMFTSPGFNTGIENHHWLAMHDGTWLFLLVVIDDAGQHQFDTRDVSNPFNDDSIELFFDGDNSQRLSYDNVDDRRIRIGLLDSDAGGSNSSSNEFPKLYTSANSAPLPPSLVFATGPSNGPPSPVGFTSAGIRQDVYEIAIRLSDINVSVGRPFGFEVQFDDDDDGLNRDAKWGWFHPPGSSACAATLTGRLVITGKLDGTEKTARAHS